MIRTDAYVDSMYCREAVGLMGGLVCMKRSKCLGCWNCDRWVVGYGCVRYWKNGLGVKEVISVLIYYVLTCLIRQIEVWKIGGSQLMLRGTHFFDDAGRLLVLSVISSPEGVNPSADFVKGGRTVIGERRLGRRQGINS